MEIYFMPDKGSGSRSGNKKISQSTKTKHMAKGKGASAAPVAELRAVAAAPVAADAGKTGQSGAAGGGGHRGR